MSTKTVVKGDATSSTLASFTAKQAAMTANGSQHTYGALWELLISASDLGVSVGGKLDRVCRWLLTKPPSAAVTRGADQRDEASAAMWRPSESQLRFACSGVSLYFCGEWSGSRTSGEQLMKCTAELRHKSNDHRSLKVTIMTSNFINAIHASRPPNAFNMFCIMIISQLSSQLQKQ